MTSTVLIAYYYSNTGTTIASELPLLFCLLSLSPASVCLECEVRALVVDKLFHKNNTQIHQTVGKGPQRTTHSVGLKGNAQLLTQKVSFHFTHT